ncbi:MAG: hypothetical protein R3222_10130, partial [Balneolaceae bacterium]|nr:hypothetical protein [Balneolaceae bacterium]
MENIIYNYDINEIQNRIASNSLDKFDPSKINRRIKGIKVLMYHRIIGDNQQQRKRHWTTVSEEDFEKQ